MQVNDRLRAAYAAFSRGDLATAKNQGEAALRKHPNHPVILQLLGVVMCQAGDLSQGIDYLQRALKNGGDSPDLRHNLSKALIAVGRTEEAVTLNGGGNEASNSAQLQRMQADALKAEGRIDEAVWAYEDIVAEHPKDFETWNNLGNARHERGDLEGALTALHEARQIDETSTLVHTNIGRVLVSLDRYEEACIMFEKAALLAPREAAPLIELARTLISIDHAQAGLRALGAAAQLDPRNPDVFAAMGLAFTDLADLTQAEKAYRIAVQVEPNHAAAYLELGMLLEKANRLDELDAVVAQASRTGAIGPEIDYLKALGFSREGRHEEALALARAVHSNAIDSAMLAQFIGQQEDRLGNVDAAFIAYEDMNRASSQTPLAMGIDREAYQRRIVDFSARTTAEWFDRWKSVAPQSHPPAPVFLVGFPRSGTTLLDTILMGHSETHVLEELPIIDMFSREIGGLEGIADLDEERVVALRARYFEELDRLSPGWAGKLVIDKNPLSMIRIPLIHRLFPDTKIILALRHPADIVLSCYMQNFKPTEPMSSFLDLANASRTYDRIFAYWEKCTDIFPLNVHELRYEAMVENPEAAIRPVFDFLELDWEEQALDHQKTAAERGYIRTPSYAQVTEKIYATASGRWQRYRNYMNEVLPILGPWATKFGYKLD